MVVQELKVEQVTLQLAAAEVLVAVFITKQMFLFQEFWR